MCNFARAPCVNKGMDVRRRSRLRAVVCAGLPALALALCAVLGLGAGVAHAVSSDHSHTAVTPVRQHLPTAFLRMHDPIAFDVVAADQPTQTSRTAERSAPLTSSRQVSVPRGTDHNRGPPAGEHF
jgi:hypothetical protein